MTYPPWACPGTYPPLGHVWTRSPPHLSIKPCQNMKSFGNLVLLFIAMTHAECGLNYVLLLKIAMTYTIGHVWASTPFPQTCSSTYPVPLKHVRARTVPHLSIKLCLGITSFGNVLLLFIAMTHAGCGLKLCTVTINSDDTHPN